MKIFLDSIGCRLNQSEIEKMAAQFRVAGHELVGSDAEADLVVINTCAVTSEASSDSRGKVRHAARAGVKQVVVTGCWATLDPQAAAELPSVMRVVGNEGKERLVSDLFDLPQVFDLEPLARKPLPGLHRRTRAFIKAQDGCDNHCTYCITRIVRGRARSVPAIEVIRDIEMALMGGAKEVVLTGVHLGSWGQDLDEKKHLRHLVAEVLQYSGAERVRLSSLEPWDLDEGFFELFADARLCQHLHLPLQSGCAATLRRMARNVTPDGFEKLVDMARKAAPEMSITTDMIVGFPGESETEFEESLAFAKAMEFAGGHVFTYSPRPGTAAARLPNPVHPKVAKARSARLRQALSESEKAFQTRFIGCEMSVLWEAAHQFGPEGWQVSGLTGNYIRVHAASPDQVWNQIIPAHLVEIAEDGMRGVIL